MKRTLPSESREHGRNEDGLTNKSPLMTEVECRKATISFKPSEISSGSLSGPSFESEYGCGQTFKWKFYIKWNESGSLGVFLRVDQAMSGPSEKTARTFVAPLEAGFSVEISNPNNLNDNKKYICANKDYKSLPTATWGITNLISMDNLNKYIGKDEKVTFSFELSLVKPKTNASMTTEDAIMALENESRDLCIQNILDALDENEYCDVTVKTSDDISFKAHKVILGGRSEFFRNILQEKKESRITNPLERMDLTSEVIEVNKPAHVMKPILCYIYNGTLLPQWIDPKTVTLEQAKETLLACEEFGIPYLQHYYKNFYPGLKEALGLKEDHQ